MHTPSLARYFRRFVTSAALIIAALRPTPAAAQFQQNATAAQIAAAMDIPASAIVSATVVQQSGPSARATSPSFGPNVVPAVGSSMAVLSSGSASTPTQPGYVGGNGTAFNTLGTAPANYPPASMCPTASPRDLTEVNVQILMPAGTSGFKFDFNYYSHDYPAYICTSFSDAFAAVVARADADTVISFDSQGRAITSNSAFFAAPQTIGNTILQGTGFEAGGATDWLTASATASPGEVVTLKLFIWDGGDGIADSTVLLDNFRWTLDDSVVTVDAGADVTLVSGLTGSAAFSRAGVVTGPAANVQWNEGLTVLSQSTDINVTLGLGVHTLTFYAIKANGEQVSDSVIVTVQLPGGGGAQGPAGPAGPQGIPGAQGAQGATGAQGPQGEPGPMGPAGPAGVMGPAGPAGPAGATGAAGPRGARGPEGRQGEDGERGERGPRGLKGDKGDPGELPAGTVIFVWPNDPAPAGWTLVATFKQEMEVVGGKKGNQPVVIRVYRKQ